MAAQDLEMYIMQGYTFAKLPMALKQALGNSKREWEKAVVEFSLSHQLRWRKHIVRKILEDEKKYYSELLQYSRDHLMLYPYHLADVMANGLRTTPFTYYYNILHDMLRSDKSYDSLPNFTAADCLRLLGIGRNQYIDLMNQTRSKQGLGLFKKRVNPKTLLPTRPITPVMEHWWEIHLAYVSEEDIKGCSAEERVLIDRMIDTQSYIVAGTVDRAVVEALYMHNLVHLAVPIADTDCIVVPPLEGFVMNRVLGDFFENLLYKIFVSIDEHTTVAELATVLRIDLQLVKDAVSMYCRLGFARKKGFEALPRDGGWHESWQTAAVSSIPTGPSLLEVDRQDKGQPTLNALVSDLNTGAGAGASRTGRRLALLFDASLTAVLMMGNLSTSLKTHAVTMFEAGKLSDESLDSLMSELGKMDLLSEGDTQHYFDHAFTLLQTLFFLRHNPTLSCIGDETGKGLSLDLLKCESLNSLDSATCARVLRKNYTTIVSMAPLSRTVRSVISCNPVHFGPAIPETSSVWFKLWLYEKIRAGPPSILFVAGWRVRHLPRIFLRFETVLLVSWTQDPQEVSTASCLPALNEALCASPVLVQGHRLRSDVETIHIPFPFAAGLSPMSSSSLLVAPTPTVAAAATANESTPTPTLTPAPAQAAAVADSDSPTTTTTTTTSVEAKDSHASGATAAAAAAVSDGAALLNLPDSLQAKVDRDTASREAWIAACGELSSLPMLHTLSHELRLDVSFGYVTLLRQVRDGDESPPELEATVANRGWSVAEVVFGIPIFDAALNRAVCHRIRTHRLLSESNAIRAARVQRETALDLLDFIAQHQCLPLNVSSESSPARQAVAYPTECLQCVNGVITPFVEA